MAMGKRIPISPKAPATSHRVRGRLKACFSTEAAVSTVRFRVSGSRLQVTFTVAALCERRKTAVRYRAGCDRRYRRSCHCLFGPARHRSDNHDLSRLDERGGSLADLQAEVSSGVPGNDGGDSLPADIE